MVPVIGFDFRMAQAYGIGTYIRSLLSAAKQSSLPFHIKLLGRFNEAKEFLQDERFSFASCPYAPYNLSGHSFFRQQAQDIPLVHYPHYNASFFSHRFVATIHDIIPILFPRSLSFPLALPYVFLWHYWTVKRAAHLICVSQTTKNDLSRVFRVPERKMTVIYEGVDLKIFPLSEKGAKLKSLQKISHSPYFLYVGGNKAHKNLPVLLKAFALFKKRVRTAHHLVLVGTRRIPIKQDDKLCRVLHIVPRAEPEEIGQFYAQAEALIYPSLYEGFGLPPLEAYHYGCPVICSRSGSLPEINGDVPLYIDARDPEDISRKMEELLRNPSLCSKMIKKGREKLQHFSWKNAFAQTYRVYQDFLA